jgi:hypothetical protein
MHRFLDRRRASDKPMQERIQIRNAFTLGPDAQFTLTTPQGSPIIAGEVDLV